MTDTDGRRAGRIFGGDVIEPRAMRGSMAASVWLPAISDDVTPECFAGACVVRNACRCAPMAALAKGLAPAKRYRGFSLAPTPGWSSGPQQQGRPGKPYCGEASVTRQGAAKPAPRTREAGGSWRLHTGMSCEGHPGHPSGMARSCSPPGMRRVQGVQVVGVEAGKGRRSRNQRGGGRKWSE